MSSNDTLAPFGGLFYDPDTGIVTKDGREIGTSSYGYIRYRINGRLYYLHRIIWFLQTDKWPEMIDHINGSGTDNRWCNLREVTNQQNQYNRGVPKNSTTGVKGVSWSKGRNKYRAHITINYKTTHLGYYNSLAGAAAARKEAEYNG